MFQFFQTFGLGLTKAKKTCMGREVPILWAVVDFSDYGPMDRTVLAQERADILEAFKDFPLTHSFFDKLERGQTGGIARKL